MAGDLLDWAGRNAATFKDYLARGVIAPLNLVLLTHERIQEAVDELVSRGRMSSEDANELVQTLVRRGRRETDDVLADLDRLLGRSIEGEGMRDLAAKQVTRATETLRGRGRGSAGSPGAAGPGASPSLPIDDYDDLTAAQIEGRLVGLTPAELRKVRDHERRNANRKTVLAAVDALLH